MSRSTRDRLAQLRAAVSAVLARPRAPHATADAQVRVFDGPRLVQDLDEEGVPRLALAYPVRAALDARVREVERGLVAVTHAVVFRHEALAHAPQCVDCGITMTPADDPVLLSARPPRLAHAGDCAERQIRAMAEARAAQAPAALR